MNIRYKFVLLLALAFFIPLLFLGLGAMYSLRSVSDRAVSNSTHSLINSEKTRLEQITADQATALADLLDSYIQDTVFLQQYFYSLLKNASLFDTSAFGDLYPEKKKLGFPGYGYVHEIYGSYADFDMRGTSSPSITKPVIDRALSEDHFKKLVIQDLDRSMLMGEVLSQIQKKYRDTIDLVWIVFVSGITNAAPPYNYLKILSNNPELSSLDENQQSYVDLLNDKNNPSKKTLLIEPYLDPLKNIWMTSTIAPLYENDKFIGTVGMDILLNTLIQKVLNIKVGAEGYAFLVSKTGSVMAVPERGVDDLLWDDLHKKSMREILRPCAQQKWTQEMVQAMQIPLTQSPHADLLSIVSAAMSGQSQITPISFSGREKFVSMAPLPLSGWSIGLVVPVEDILATSRLLEAEVDAASDDIIFRFLIFCFFILLISVFLAIIFHFHVLKPISFLTDSISRVGWDNLQFDDDRRLKRNDEIGTLYGKLGEMMQVLKSARDDLTANSLALDKANRNLTLTNAELSTAKHDLQTWGQRLENEVAERTQQLDKAYEQLRHSEQLAVLGKLAGAFSHELRNPLAAIKQAAQLSLEAPDQNDLGENLQIILRQTEMAIKIVTDALEFARPRKLHLERGDLCLLVDQILADVPIPARIHIEKNYQPSSIYFVFDQLRLRHALLNLLHNSLQSISSEGRISIEVCGSSDFVEIKLSDTGHGIEPEHLEKIFEPFFTTKKQGVGLGLYVTKSIVEMHGGKISFSSHLGQGVTVRVVLPFSHGT